MSVESAHGAGMATTESRNASAASTPYDFLRTANSLPTARVPSARSRFLAGASPEPSSATSSGDVSTTPMRNGTFMERYCSSCARAARR